MALANHRDCSVEQFAHFHPLWDGAKLKDDLCYNFGSVAAKQHAVSMSIDQEHKPTEALHTPAVSQLACVADQQNMQTETLQEYVQRFSDLLLKYSSLLLHQTKDLADISHFICSLHNQKLQHYVLGKNQTSVQIAISLAQKKDAELHIIEGLHICDPEHEINHISNKLHHSQSNAGSCHVCNGPHLIRDCENSVCKRCKVSLDNHVPARCPTRKHPAKQQRLNSLYNDSFHRNWFNVHSDIALQLSVPISKLDHIFRNVRSNKK